MERKTEGERASRPHRTEIPSDPDQIARIEARNALRQFDAVVRIIEEALQADTPFKLRPSLLLELNRLAIEGVDPLAGVYRPHGSGINGSEHDPPNRRDVPRLVEELCDYVNDNWRKLPIHLAAYVLWQVNWIHPFSDGNGRTARALSYVVLSIRLGYKLPGTNTIPDQIAADKFPYYEALEAADAAYREERIDVSALESLLSEMLALQLVELHKQATGR